MARGIEVRYLPVAKLQPYAGNARTHTPEQIEEIAGSIRRFGFTNPVLLWIAIELSPAYVDVAVLRWQAFTGLQAMLDGGGELFDALSKKRKKKSA